MPDVTLINPPSFASNPTLPPGIASIAAVLREQGVSVAVIDAWALGLGVEGIIASLRRDPPSYGTGIVSWSAYLLQCATS